MSQIATTDRTDRLAVLHAYAIVPNVMTAAERACVPHSTALKWVRDAKASGELEDIVEAIKQVRLRQLTEILDLTGEALLDRLRNGDTVLDDGVLRKVPVKSRDVAAIRQVVAAESALLAQSTKPEGKLDANLLAIASELEGYIKAKAKVMTSAPVADVSSLLGSDVAKLVNNQDVSSPPSAPHNVTPAVKSTGEGGNGEEAKVHNPLSQILQTPEGGLLAAGDASGAVG